MMVSSQVPFSYVALTQDARLPGHTDDHTPTATAVKHSPGNKSDRPGLET